MLSAIHPVVPKLAQFLNHRQLTLCTAESCTGGMVAAALTDLPGSSAWFERGFVTYSNASKQENLGVSMDLIQSLGAVSAAVAKEMAIGALKNSSADVSLAITGVAGPSGGSIEKPVGYVCFAWALKKDKQYITSSEEVSLLSPQDTIDDMTRQHVRLLARDYALQGLITLLEKSF